MDEVNAEDAIKSQSKSTEGRKLKELDPKGDSYAGIANFKQDFLH